MDQSQEKIADKKCDVAASRQSAAFIGWDYLVGGGLPTRRYANVQSAHGCAFINICRARF
jgi:hypothetical protein